MAIDPSVNVNLAKYTTFGIGGDADLFFIAKNRDELVEALNFAYEKDIEFKIIGGGSNLLISDKGVRGLVILYRQGEYKIKDERVIADGGANLGFIARETIAKGYKGLEFATGIPGTIAGAVAGNAGAYGKSMENALVSAEVWQDGKMKTYLKDDFEYTYRFSRLKNSPNRVIVSVTLKLERGNKEEMLELANYDVGRRSAAYGGRNAGSYFCNVPIKDLTEEQAEKLNKFVDHGKLCVGKMIDELGLKGLKVGNAMVSTDHANVIQNLGGATAAEVIELERTVVEKVLAAYGIILRPEVTKIGEF